MKRLLLLMVGVVLSLCTTLAQIPITLQNNDTTRQKSVVIQSANTLSQDLMNYTIGEAIYVTGKISLIVGTPCLAAGITCNILAHTLPVADPIRHPNQYARDVKRDSNLLEASYILMPTGASLAIVGIPLFIRGKEIMSLSFEYDNNGLGVAINF